MSCFSKLCSVRGFDSEQNERPAPALRRLLPARVRRETLHMLEHIVYNVNVDVGRESR
ncbi:unnamed protein product [Leptidea sinapis]|uniref:Uncharacterized protein n=1 Tax=Leptidea sinapis TaxID=189913 RepID=A0A5E4R348_9NEOP|nr:unnamed protein product [Leptidea sinapis]